MKRRLFSFLLAVVMVFSLASVGFATETTADAKDAVAKVAGESGDAKYYTDLASAIEAAGEDDTITLLADVKAGDGFAVATGKKVTIDLNDCTYTVSSTGSTNATGVLVEGELTLTNGTLNVEQTNTEVDYLVNVKGGKLTVEDATVDATGKCPVTLINKGNGTTTIKNANIKNETFDTAVKAESANVVINSGVVTGKVVGTATTMDIFGGTFTDGETVKGIVSDVDEWNDDDKDEDGNYTRTLHADVDEDGVATIEACDKTLGITHEADKDTHHYYCSECGKEYSSNLYVEVTDPVHTYEGEVIYDREDLPEDAVVADEDTDLVEYKHEKGEDGKAVIANGIGLQYCSECETWVLVEVEVEHTFDETEYVDPTCDKNGYTKEICSVCGIAGAEIEDEDSKLNYEHEYMMVTTQYPSCANGNKGIREKICVICGDKTGETKTFSKYVNDAGNKVSAEHVWVIESEDDVVTEGKCVVKDEDGNVVTAAVAGSASFKCTVCGKVEVREIVDTKTGHAYNWKVTKEPTCNEDGLAQKVCLLCGDVQEGPSMTIKATLNHKFEEGITNPTCVDDSVTGLVCSICKTAYSTQNTFIVNAGTALGHDWQEPVCTDKDEEGNAVEHLACEDCNAVRECARCDVTENVKVDGECVAGDAEYVAENCYHGAYWITKCIYCDKTMSKTYVVGSEPTAESGQHTWEKDEDGKVIVTILTPATCVDNAVVQYVCSECGFVEEHTWASNKWHEGNSGVNEAQNASTSEYLSDKVILGNNVNLEQGTKHDYAWIEGSGFDATCTEAGYGDFYCKYCETTYINQEIPAGHDMELDESQHKDATCAEAGVDVYVCTKCDDYTVSVEIPKLPSHPSESIEVINDVENGYTIYKCQICGDVDAIDLTSENDNDYLEVCLEGNHPVKNQVEIEAVDPTCVEDGQGVGIWCENCENWAVEPEVIPATGHDWDEGTVLTEATCDTDGVTVVTCKTCGYSENQVVEATGHDWADATCTDAKTCSVCGVTEGTALGHKANDATCTEASVCSVCEEVLAPALGHKYGELTGVVAATYHAAGYTGDKTCSVCGDVVKGEVVPALGCPSALFTDVASDAWYHEYVDIAAGNKLMQGKPGNVFDPEGNMTRAEMATVLYNLAGKPSVAGLTENFTDVASDNWFYAAVVWAADEGVVNGRPGNVFDPNANVTREEMITMLWRYAGKPEVAASVLNTYADASTVNTFAVGAFAWGVENGIITGREGAKLVPAGTAIRAELATILARYIAL